MINFTALANLFRFPAPSHVGIKDQRIRDFVRNSRASADKAPLATPGGVVLERLKLAKEVIKLVKGITTPALVIHARDDDYAGLDNATYLQTQLGGPVDLTVLDDSYHMVTVDRQRQVVVERTIGFAARITAMAQAVETAQFFRNPATGIATPSLAASAA